MKLALGAFALLVAGALAMLLAGVNPAAGYFQLLRGALGNEHHLAETLVQTTALLFPSLGVAFAFRAGLFNIGAEGQLVVGGLCAGLLGAALPGGALAIGAMLVAGALGGAAWGGIAGAIRARFGSSEVIATLMLNVIAALLANYLVSGPLHSPAALGNETAELPVASWLPLLLPGTRLTIALPLALALALGLRWFFARTVLGYELRAAGEAPDAARRAGIDPARVALGAMSVSGAIAGLGGATIVAGILHRFDVALGPGYGFIAIAVALVGRLDPLWIVLAAFAFGILQSGSLSMQAYAHVPKDVVTVIEGLAILALAAQPALTRRAAAGATESAA